MLVPAVLRPQEREDRELEVVRLALQQGADAVELPVRQAERTVKGLMRDSSDRHRLDSSMRVGSRERKNPLRAHVFFFVSDAR
jgi:hypothetical protein